MKRSPKPDALANQIVASEPPEAGVEGVEGGAEPGAQADWPAPCGDFDIRIARDGRWFYHGSPINRIALVKLFASVLRRDADGAYWLVTPAEAVRVRVDDVPFTVVALSATGTGRAQVLTVRTNLDESVIIDAEHGIRVAAPDVEGARIPHIRIRDGLEARVLRAVYYDLIARGVDAAQGNDQIYGVWSAGRFFPLGTINDNS